MQINQAYGHEDLNKAEFVQWMQWNWKGKFVEVWKFAFFVILDQFVVPDPDSTPGCFAEGPPFSRPSFLFPWPRRGQLLQSTNRDIVK